MGIEETLRQALAKLVMRAAGDQAKTVCGNLQLCAGLNAGKEGATHAVGQRRLAHVRERREATEEEESAEAKEEEDGGGIAASLHNLNIELGVTVEEATEDMAEALGMEVEEEGYKLGRRRGCRDSTGTGSP